MASVREPCEGSRQFIENGCTGVNWLFLPVIVIDNECKFSFWYIGVSTYYVKADAYYVIGFWLR